MQQTILFTVPGKPSTRPLIILSGLTFEAQCSTPISVRLSRALSSAIEKAKCNCTRGRINDAVAAALGIAAFFSGIYGHDVALMGCSLAAAISIFVIDPILTKGGQNNG